MKITISSIERSDIGLFGIANRSGIEGIVDRPLPVIYPMGRVFNLRLIPVMTFILLSQLVRYRSLSQVGFLVRVSYIASGIRKMGARTVITYVDESCEFYFLKHTCPDVIFVSIQNGHRGPFPLFEGLRKLSEVGLPKPKCDVIFVWTEGFAAMYRERIEATVIVSGSLLNNQAPRLSPSNRERRLAFVSTFFPFEQLRTELDKQTEMLVRKHAQEVLSVAREWCGENDYSIVVLGRFPGEEETYFFRSCLEQEPVFSHWDPLFRNIMNLEKVDLVLSCLSSLGLESIGRGCRTAICWPPEEFSVDFYSSIESFSSLGDRGPFWATSVDEQEIRRVLDFICLCSESQWNEIVSEYSEKFCFFDPGNSIVKSRLLGLINQ